MSFSPPRVRIALGVFELIDGAAEKLELAHDQVLAEDEAHVVVQCQREPRALLAGIEVLADFLTGQFLTLSRHRVCI